MRMCRRTRPALSQRCIVKKTPQKQPPRKGVKSKIVPKHEPEVLAKDNRDLDALVKAGEDAIAKIGTGAHIEDWLVVGAGLNVGVEMALKAGKMRSRPYNEEMGAWLMDHPLYNEEMIDKDTRMSLIALYRTEGAIEALNAVRAAMTPGQRSRMSSPRAAWDRVKDQFGKAPAKKREREPSTAVEAQGELGEALSQLAKAIPVTGSHDDIGDHIAELWRDAANRPTMRFISFTIDELSEATEEKPVEKPKRGRGGRNRPEANA